MSHTVSVHYLRLLTDYLRQKAISVPGFLADAGFNSDLLEDSNNRVSFMLFAQLCETAKTLLNEPMLGLKLAQQVKPSHLGALGFALMACPTGLEMMKLTSRYTSLAMDAAHTTFERQGDLYIRYRRSNLPGGKPLGQLQDELSHGVWVTLGRWLWNREDLDLSWVSFTYAAPSDCSEYEQFFRCPVRFSADETAIAYRASGVLVPAPQGDAQMFGVMGDLCEERLQALMQELVQAPTTDQAPSWLSQLSLVLRQGLQDSKIDAEHIADKLGLTESQMKHQLSEHGHSYRSFVDDLRHEIAAVYIRDATLSLSLISQLLGFSEQSAFQRAFKRWTGMSPRKYRIFLESH